MSVAKHESKQKDEEQHIFDDFAISELYKDVDRRCSNCEKLESDFNGSVKFGVCSKCKLAMYCSKTCQEQHWKVGGHKERCLRNTSSSSKNTKKKMMKKKASFLAMSDDDKVTHFMTEFEPLLTPLAMTQFSGVTGNDYGRSSWLGTTHVLCIELKETSCYEAPSSPLYIHEVFLQKFANQSPEWKWKLDVASQSPQLSSLGPRDGRGFIKFFVHQKEEVFGMKIHVMSTSFPDMFTAYVGGVGAGKTRKEYEHRADLVCQQINAMAKGTAPSSLKAANKGKMAC